MREDFFQIDTAEEAVSLLARSRGLTFREISERTKIHPSYFSRVLKGRASFSQLQLFRLAEIFDLEIEESEYFFLLWNIRESQDASERSYFKLRQRQIQEKHLNLKGRVKRTRINGMLDSLNKSHSDIGQFGSDLAIEKKQVDRAIYYAEAISAEIHMALTLSRFQANPLQLCSLLRISSKKLNSELAKLAALGLIKQAPSGRIIEVLFDIHLDEKSSLSFQNHINWRMKAIQNLELREQRDSDYHCSVCFTADIDTQFKIKKRLREVLLEIREMVGASDHSNEVFHLMMDLF